MTEASRPTEASDAACTICAAPIGSVYYAVAAISGYEIALIALLVGYLVGGGVRLGARGRTGRRYRILAVGLTYLAIGSTYVPFVIKGAAEAFAPSALGKAEARAQAKRPHGSAESDAQNDGEPREADATDLATAE